jgi:hypothetical protein
MRDFRFFFPMKHSRERHNSLLSRSLWLRHSLSYLSLKVLSADLVHLLVLAGNATGTGSVEETDETHETAALPSPFVGRSQILSDRGSTKDVQFCSLNDRIVTHPERHDAGNASLLILGLTVYKECGRMEVDHNGFSFDAILQVGRLRLVANGLVAARRRRVVAVGGWTSRSWGHCTKTFTHRCLGVFFVGLQRRSWGHCTKTSRLDARVRCPVLLVDGRPAYL